MKTRTRHASLFQISALAQNIKYSDVVSGVELGCMLVVLINVALARQMVGFVILVRLINAVFELLDPKPKPARHGTAFVNLKDVNVDTNNSPLSIIAPLFTHEKVPIVTLHSGWGVMDRLKSENNPPSISSCPSSPLLDIDAAHEERATPTWAPRMPDATTVSDRLRFKRTGKVILNDLSNDSFGKRSTQSC